MRRSYTVQAECPSCRKVVGIRVCGGNPNGDGLHQSRRLAVEMHQRMEGCGADVAPATPSSQAAEQLSLLDLGTGA